MYLTSKQMGPVVLRLEDFEAENYSLIAIHSSRKEDFKVTYLINTILGLYLERTKTDVEVETDQGLASFSLFEYDDPDYHVLWKLVSNKAFILPESQMASPLFQYVVSTISKQGYLLPEHKTVDYFLKVENTDEQFEIGTVIEKLKSIKIISTAYEIRVEAIKSKNNLIF